MITEDRAVVSIFKKDIQGIFAEDTTDMTIQEIWETTLNNMHLQDLKV